MRASTVIVAVAVAAFWAVAASYATGMEGGKPQVIEIELKEFAFVPGKVVLPAGSEVVLELRNTGKLKHEFMVGRGLTEAGAAHGSSGAGHQAGSGRHGGGGHMHGSATETEGEGGMEGHGHMPEGMKEHMGSGMHHGMGKGMMGGHGASGKGFREDFFEGLRLDRTLRGATFAVVPGHGTMFTLEPGGSATVKFRVPEERRGEWMVGCFVPGHFEAGMKGELRVE